MSHSITACVSAFWHALAKTHGNRKDLRDGGRYRVDGHFVGTVGGRPIDETIAGTLIVSGPVEKPGSAAVDTTHYTAWLWQQIPASRRADLRAELLETFGATGEPPAVEERDLEAAKLLLKQLRTTKVTKSQGGVSFELDPEAAAAAAA